MVKNRKAEGYIDVCIAVLIFSFLLSLTVALIGALNTKAKLEYMADELIKSCADNGGINDKVTARFNELKAETKMNPSVKYETEYYDYASKKVQFGTTITATLEYTVGLPGFMKDIFKVKLTSVRSAPSEVYWK